ncbi:hypothetical protein QYG89_02145 [Bacillus sp. B190/17]|uniref:Uncharacterized protein n=1 Tax=Bacillus lumedeiriae TaxID=3058829 RepID=A0ABW8I5J0_9BACI
MKIINVELQYDQKKVKGDVSRTLNNLLKTEGIEVLSVHEETSQGEAPPLDTIPDTNSAGAGGMGSPD